MYSESKFSTDQVTTSIQSIVHQARSQFSCKCFCIALTCVNVFLHLCVSTQSIHISPSYQNKPRKKSYMCSLPAWHFPNPYAHAFLISGGDLFICEGYEQTGLLRLAEYVSRTMRQGESTLHPMVVLMRTL